MPSKPSYEELEKRVQEIEKLELERSKTEEELEQIFSMSLDMICIADINTATFIKVNSAFTEILGHSEEALLKQPFLDFVHPDDIHATLGIIDKELQAGAKVINFENRYRCKDGSYRWLSWVSHPNPVKGVTYAIARDITERKQQELELIESKALLDATGRMAKVGGWELDADTLEVSWTEETYRIHEVPLDYHPPMQEAINFFHPEDRDRLERAIQRALDSGEPYDMEVRFITAKGKHRWTRTICRPEIVNGKTVKLKGTFQDITERKQAEESLRKSEKKFKDLADLMPEAVFETDAKMNLVYVNQQAFSLFKYTQEDFEKGLNALEMISSEDRKRAQENIAKRFHGEELGSTEYNAIRKDGSTFPVFLHANPIFDRDTVKGLRGIIIDLTEHKRLEAQLQQAQKIESIGNLAGGIAHDFNNILFPIVGMSEMLIEDLPAESSERESAIQIFNAAMRGRDLVKQILAFSRQSEHKMIPTRIQNVLKEVLKLSRSTIPTYINIKQDLQQDCGLVMADPSQIHQVGMNIITNAYHALADTGGEINVVLKQITIENSESIDIDLSPGSYVVLSISDTGHGMSKKLIHKIFDPYFTTKEQGKGTGLGLAVVYGIITEHRGAIKVYSKIGEGSTFDMYLPLMEKSKGIQSFPSIQEYQGGHERILLVDDEKSVVKLEKQMLERMGYTVTPRLHSIEALEAFKANPHSFDLVITDMSMPNMPGDLLAKKIKSIRSDIAIIICTGFSERIREDKIKDMGLDGLLMKPVVKADLAKTVRKVLDGARQSKNES